jgi:predicted bacteriocin transport accessory protein
MKKDKQNQMKAERLVLGFVVLLIIGAISIAVWAINSRNNTPPANNDTGQNQNDGPDFSALASIDSQGVLDFLSSGKSGFLYAGRPTCPHCQVFAPILIEVAKEKDLEVFYFNTDVARGEEARNDALDALGVDGVPNFMYVQGGRVVARLADTASRDALLEFIKNNP